MSEPLRQLESRVGSATDALTPLSRATRSFAATPVQWLALAAIAVAAVVADQVTKHIVAANLSLGEGVHVIGPFTIRHVQNSGIAFGLFSNATPVVLLTGWGQGIAASEDAPQHVDRVLGKPPKLRDLREALAELCKSAAG